MPGFINSQVVVLFTKDKLTPQNLLASAFRAILPDYSNHLETVGDIVNYLVFWIRYQAPNGTPNIVFNSVHIIVYQKWSHVKFDLSTLHGERYQ